MKSLKHITWRFLYILRTLLDPLVRFKEVSVLCYHSVSNSSHDTAVSASQFEKQLTYIKSKGYTFVPLEQIVEWQAGRGDVPRKAVALSFDDGYADFKSTVTPLLIKYQVPATVFVLGDPNSTGWRLDKEAQFLTPEDIQDLRSNSLVEVGYHTQSHPNLAKLSPTAISQQVTPPNQMRFFAYPGGNHSSEARAEVQKAGYEAAWTIRPTLVHTWDDPYLLPRTVVLGDMSLEDIAARVSKAADWYQRLRSLRGR